MSFFHQATSCLLFHQIGSFLYHPSVIYRISFYTCLLTHLLYQQPHIKSFLMGEPAMNFSSSCPVNFSVSLVPQTAYYFMLPPRKFFHPSCLSPSNVFCFSPTGSISTLLFRDGKMMPTPCARRRYCQCFGKAGLFKCLFIDFYYFWNIFSGHQSTTHQNTHTHIYGHDSQCPLPLEI